jgi:GWxTD domain-containing protein
MPAWALASLALLALLATTACGSTPPASRRSLVDLTNPFLGPEYSQWLVGAIATLATPEEIDAFLALRDDAAAAELVRRFWEQRDPAPDRPDNPLLEAFEKRSAAADRLYTEAGFTGRRTARGTVFVLYGPPKDVDYQVADRAGLPPVEVWLYGDDSPSGLDGRKPESFYRFIKQGDLTVPFRPLVQDSRERVRDPGPGLP